MHKKRIAILGIGEEGLDTLEFLKKNIDWEKLGVADHLTLSEMKENVKQRIQDERIELHLGEDHLQELNDYEVIIKAPGVPLHNIKKGKDQVITSQSDIFLKNCKGTVVGITGTKGKSTTSLLIADLLKRSGLSTQLVGNIGRPALSELGNETENDFFVYELSSFQLATVTKSPHIAVMLNIFKDHLDKHKDFEDYVSSKERITRFQDERDVLIYNEKDPIIKERVENSPAKKLGFSPSSKKEGVPVPVDPVIKVAEVFRIEKRILEEVFSQFKGLPHRLEYVGEREDIYFYNDSAATIPEATLHAIKSLRDIGTIVIGGSDKGADTEELIHKIGESEIENIVILGGSPSSLKEALEKKGRKVYLARDMKEVVKISLSVTEKGKKCLLSPGFASFNMFRSYKERGDLFKKEISDLQ